MTQPIPMHVMLPQTRAALQQAFRPVAPMLIEGSSCDVDV